MLACTMVGAIFVDIFVAHAIGYAFLRLVLLGMIVAVVRRTVWCRKRGTIGSIEFLEKLKFTPSGQPPSVSAAQRYDRFWRAVAWPHLMCAVHDRAGDAVKDSLPCL